ncbi:MAG TPA: hypothetical protein VIY54_10710 [Steroidobacteraceae bacterium]
MSDAARKAASAGLEQRLGQAERAGRDRDFDSVSWWWMALLGVMLPAALIFVGWLYQPAGR